MKQNRNDLHDLSIAMHQNIKEKKYWLKKLAGQPERSHFLYDYKKTGEKKCSSVRREFDFTGEIFSKLMRLSKNSAYALYMIMTAAVTVLINKYTGNDDILVGSPIYKQEVEGKFVNTVLPLRNHLNDRMTFIELLKQVKQTITEAIEHYSYPIEILTEKLNMTIMEDGFPLFDTVVLVENVHDKRYLEPIHVNMIFSFFKTERVITGSIEYNPSMYKNTTIKQVIAHFIKLVQEIFLNMDSPVSHIKILSEAERRQLLYDFNKTEAKYPKDKTIHQLFEEQAANTPDNISLVFDGTWITYWELNEKANRLARILRAKGVTAETIVGVMVTHSLEMMVGILGVLKASGAYLPLDPMTPRNRLISMMADCQATLLLTQGSHFKTHSFTELQCLQEITVEPFVTTRRAQITPLDSLLMPDRSLVDYEKTLKTIPGISFIPGKVNSSEKFAREIIMLDDLLNTLDGQPGENLIHINQPRDLAYVIFTSGSSGKPKGVMVEHRALANLCSWHNTYYFVTSWDRASKYAGFSFDASVWEAFPYLVSGASLHVIKDEIKLDMEQLNRYFEENHITISFLPTQVCEQFMKLENHSLRVLLTGGDKLNIYIKNNYRLVNNYGPTENTVVASSCRVNDNKDNIPIGKPIFNTRIYILSKNNHLQPLGVPGELCISGDGLARGYLNQPNSTNEKFESISFIQEERLYRTGDSASWLPDGNIEYLGRIDQQVKIRGFRVECGEIESQLLNHDKIKEAAVIQQENEGGDKYLCAYWVAVDTGEANPGDVSLTPEELKEYISMELQDYMIPSYFIQLEKIPLTLNGKVDRRALAEIKPGTSRKNYVEPGSEQEKIIADVWKEVLGLGKVGIYDNFFDLGGDSIKIIKIADRLKERLNREFPIVDMFEFTTINSLAGYFGREEIEEIEEGVSSDHRAKQLKRGKTNKMQRLQMREGVQRV